MEDHSGHGNHATVLGTMDVAGKVGRAREFDGNNDAIQSPSVPRLANGTFALWVRLASLQAPPPVGEYPNLIGWSQDPGIYIQAQTGRPYLQLVFPKAGIRAVVASSPMSSSAFRHLAATWNWSGTVTTMHIFIDGLEDAAPVVVADAISTRLTP